MWKRIDPSLRLFAVGLAALLILAATEVWAALSAQSAGAGPVLIANPWSAALLLLALAAWVRLIGDLSEPARTDTFFGRMPPLLRWIAVAVIFGFIEWAYLLSPPSALLTGPWTQFLLAVGFAGLITQMFQVRGAPALDAGGLLLALFLFLYPRMVSDVLRYFPDPRVLTVLVAAGFIPLFALISILFLAPGAKLHAVLLGWRARLGRGRWLLAVLLIAAPLIVRYGISTGFYILCPNIRFALVLAVVLAAAYLLGSDPRRLITAGPFIKSAGSLVLVSAVTQALLFVSADPFSLSWSEGNRLYDYSLVFGQDLYDYNGTIPDPYNTPGRYGLWGVLYLLPGLPIWVHRLWNMILLTLPSLLLAWFLTRRLAPNDLRIGLFLWISAFFIVLAPLHPPFMITAIIVAAFAFQPSPALRAGSLIAASLYAGISRWTWVLAPGIWGGLIDLLLYYPSRKGTWFQRLLPTAAMTALGVLPGILLNLSNISAFSTGALSTANQPLLWNRLLPNSTLGPGILLLLLWTVGPLALLLVYAMWTRRWRLDTFQWIAAAGAMLGFLASGLVISAKIGGGGDLHNLDMFIVTLMFLAALGLTTRPKAPEPRSWQVWALASVCYLALLPAYPFTPFNPSAGTHAWLDFPLPQESTRALEIIQGQVAEASQGGEVLFMDQRQLLTFGYIRGVPFVPEYEKKYMMDQALASNAAYFQPYYEDLAAKRFALIVTEPLKTDLKGTQGIFAEENDLWVIYISKPTLCYYKPIMTERAVDVQLLVPRAEPLLRSSAAGRRALNLRYLLPRVVRHFLPERLVRFLLLRSWVIRPGLETSDPEAAVRRYAQVLAEYDLTLKGRRVLVFGYGGRFDIGVGLLEAGAESVVLCEKYAPPDDLHNRMLLPRYDAYLSVSGPAVRPSSARMQLLQADIREVQAADLQPADLVISNSVYEHLGDVEGITRALARVTKPDGLHIHFVDLRDHYFRYPFEMLCYSESTWRTWLNPSSNHNRYRLWDYQKAFEAGFERVDLTVLARDEAEFARSRPRVRPEFISGDAGQDSVTMIRVVALKPLRGP